MLFGGWIGVVQNTKGGWVCALAAFVQNSKSPFAPRGLQIYLNFFPVSSAKLRWYYNSLFGLDLGLKVSRSVRLPILKLHWLTSLPRAVKNGKNYLSAQFTSSEGGYYQQSQSNNPIQNDN